MMSSLYTRTRTHTHGSSIRTHAYVYDILVSMVDMNRLTDVIPMIISYIVPNEYMAIISYADATTRTRHRHHMVALVTIR